MAKGEEIEEQKSVSLRSQMERRQRLESRRAHTHFTISESATIFFNSATVSGERYTVVELRVPKAWSAGERAREKMREGGGTTTTHSLYG